MNVADLTAIDIHTHAEIAEACAEHADVLIPFASLDPWRGRSAVREARRLIERYAVRGFKAHVRFAALDIKPDVRPLILKHNAARLLGLNQ